MISTDKISSVEIQTTTTASLFQISLLNDSIIDNVRRTKVSLPLYLFVVLPPIFFRLLHLYDKLNFDDKNSENIFGYMMS